MANTETLRKAAAAISWDHLCQLLHKSEESVAHMPFRPNLLLLITAAWTSDTVSEVLLGFLPRRSVPGRATNGNRCILSSIKSCLRSTYTLVGVLLSPGPMLVVEVFIQ